METELISLRNKKSTQQIVIPQIINQIKDANWRKEPYKFQNWANWLHRMSPYVGKLKPGMAHWLIKISSKEGETILDPFCGVGTVPLESDLLKRKGIGIDLNPYAFAIARAKFDRSSLSEYNDWLNSIKLDTKDADISNMSDYVKKFYHPETLKEIIFIRNKIIKEKKYFLLGCLLGIIHGHRPGHLSAVTSLVIPYDPKEKPVYKEVIPRLKQKVKRMFIDGFPLKTNSSVINGDARNILLEDNSVDHVISSPPYFNTLDYVNDNRLRLEFLGYNSDKKDKLKKHLIQNRSDYLEEMKKVGVELRRVIKKGGFCIFILGDLHSGKNIINTAEEIGKIYGKMGFEIHGIVEDAMPTNKCIPSNVKRKKFDRILLMTNGR